MSVILGVDIGGTFTDLIAFNDETAEIVHGKSSTTPHNLAEGIITCIAKSHIEPGLMQDIIHGSTIAINTAIEKTGARTALLVTQGMRDIYTIGRGNRPEAYNILFQRPKPLVSRALTHEIKERMRSSGEVLVQVDPEQVREVAKQLILQQVEAVAVCFLHSYVNPSHEILVGDILREMLPSNCFITLSHEILRKYGEYERTSTTVLNAYIGPRVARYLGNLSSDLAGLGTRGSLYVMQSNGGVMSPQTAIQKPVAMMESGPVGGIIASAHIGKSLGFPNVIAFDMGGTTAKASLVQNSEPSTAPGYYVGGYAAGHPVMLPVVDVVEVGAGGGSIAWIDEVGALKVGPQSAGADPGPICYGQGGSQPTITDANVILGRIGREDFLGGEMALQVEEAFEGMRKQIAEPLGMDVVDAARAVVEIAVTKMSLAVREVSVEKGYDPRDFVLLASGGAGPLHAVAVARQLHIPKVIVPRYPGHFSAFGMLLTDQKHDFIQTYLIPLDDMDFLEMVGLFHEMMERARKTVALEEISVSVEYRLFFDMRYIGQEFTISVPVSQEHLDRQDKEAIRTAFDNIHDHHFGHHASGEPVEIVDLRLVVTGLRPNKPAVGRLESAANPVPHRRLAFVGDKGGGVECTVWQRETLPAGFRISGPAIISEYASTTVLYPGDLAEICETGEIIVTLGVG